MKNRLTAWIDGKAALRGLTGRSDSCSVAGCDPELVLGSFNEPQHSVLQTLHCRFGGWSSVDATPVHGAALPLLQPVSLDGGAAVVQRRIPGQGHGGCCSSNYFGVTWRSGEAERILELDFLWIAAVADAVLVLSFDPELVSTVQVQFVDLQEQKHSSFYFYKDVIIWHFTPLPGTLILLETLSYILNSRLLLCGQIPHFVCMFRRPSVNWLQNIYLTPD